jgi:transposase
VAVTTVAELGDLTRFETPRALMQCWGLIPAEYATGERRRQGSMTPAGHTQARHALVEGAWAYRYPAKVSRHLPLRRAKPPKIIQDISCQFLAQNTHPYMSPEKGRKALLERLRQRM